MCRFIGPAPVAPEVVFARMAAVIAAMPEENATAASAPSSCASADSKRATVGFQSRA